MQSRDDTVESILWDRISSALNLQAGLLVKVGNQNDQRTCLVITSYNVPTEPFNGVNNVAVCDVINDIYSKSQTPHEHGIKNFALSGLIKRLGRNCHIAAVVMFQPLHSDAGEFVFLGCPKGNKRDTKLMAQVEKLIAPLVSYISSMAKLSYFETKLEFTELYTREVGHDLASCVQAIMGQLSFMSKGTQSLKSMARKAGDVLKEVKNMYGIAESLEFTLDRDYSVQARQKIDLLPLINDVKEQYQAEADEKNIKLDVKINPRTLYIIGERSAIRQCLIHLLINGIKYSHDNTTVSISCSKTSEEVLVFVSNTGVGLPKGSEANNIWDFGYRSEYAKERHVNGSGIGLYTAKKITLAHGGRIWTEDYQSETRFIMAFPLKLSY